MTEKKYHPEKVKFTCHHGVSHYGQSFCERCLRTAMNIPPSRNRKQKQPNNTLL